LPSSDTTPEPVATFAPLTVTRAAAPGGMLNAVQFSYPPEPGGPVPATRWQLPAGAGGAVGDAVATGTVGGGFEGGAADAVRAGGPIVLGGGVVADATGSVADGDGGASSVGAGVGATVGAIVGTAGTTRRVAGGDTDSPVGLTAASPRVDGAREVPAESTSQMATATALRPRTRSTPRAERMVAVTRYCHGPQDPSQAVLGASAARIMATGEARLTALDDAPFHLRVGQCVGHCFDDLRSTASPVPSSSSSRRSCREPPPGFPVVHAD